MPSLPHAFTQSNLFRHCLGHRDMAMQDMAMQVLYDNVGQAPVTLPSKKGLLPAFADGKLWTKGSLS